MSQMIRLLDKIPRHKKKRKAYLTVSKCSASMGIVEGKWGFTTKAESNVTIPNTGRRGVICDLN